MSIKAREPGDGKSTGSKSYAVKINALTNTVRVKRYLREFHSATVPTLGRPDIYSDLDHGLVSTKSDPVQNGAREFVPVQNGAKLLYCTRYSLGRKLPKGSAYAKRRTSVVPLPSAGATGRHQAPLCLQEDSDSEHHVFVITEARS
jgi:hypothetical protein